jgi:hypothetical protein
VFLDLPEFDFGKHSCAIVASEETHLGQGRGGSGLNFVDGFGNLA